MRGPVVIVLLVCVAADEPSPWSTRHGGNAIFNCKPKSVVFLVVAILEGETAVGPGAPAPQGAHRVELRQRIASLFELHRVLSILTELDGLLAVAHVCENYGLSL